MAIFLEAYSAQYQNKQSQALKAWKLVDEYVIK